MHEVLHWWSEIFISMNLKKLIQYLNLEFSWYLGVFECKGCWADNLACCLQKHVQPHDLGP